jgi:hypothetical protein
MGLVTTHDIKKKRLRKATINHQTYKLLYQRLANKIKSIQDVKPPLYTTTWQLPSIFPGRPLYDQHRAWNYIRDKLLWGGFETNIDSNFVIWVSWESIVKPKKTIVQPEQLQKMKKQKEKKEKEKALLKKESNILESMAQRASDLAERLRY